MSRQERRVRRDGRDGRDSIRVIMPAATDGSGRASTLTAAVLKAAALAAAVTEGAPVPGVVARVTWRVAGTGAKSPHGCRCRCCDLWSSGTSRRNRQLDRQARRYHQTVPGGSGAAGEGGGWVDSASGHMAGSGDSDGVSEQIPEAARDHSHHRSNSRGDRSDGDGGGNSRRKNSHGSGDDGGGGQGGLASGERRDGGVHPVAHPSARPTPHPSPHPSPSPVQPIAAKGGGHALGYEGEVSPLVRAVILAACVTVSTVQHTIKAVSVSSSFAGRVLLPLASCWHVLWYYFLPAPLSVYSSV